MGYIAERFRSFPTFEEWKAGKESGDKKEKHSVIEPQDLTTIVVSTKNAGAKIITNKDKAKENLNKLSHEFKDKLKTRGFLSSLKESIAGQRLVEQSSYFDFNTPNSEITLRISNHNANGENFDGDREAISVVIKSERTKNTFEEGENLTEFVYFKERIAQADGNTLSQIAESIKDLLDTGVYVDKSGLAVVNPSDSEHTKVKRADEESDVSDVGTRFSIVTDDELIKRLDADEKVIGFRNVVLNEDGTFGSPMANSLRSTDRKSKEKTSSFEMNKWEMSEERPHLVDENGKITLVKPDGKAVEKVDYNPYIHNRLNKVNKQFKQAWERPNLVYIKTEIPLSDLESGYHADKAKLPVGEHKWNGGNLILSRYDKPVEICDWNDVADDWEAEFGKNGIHFDIIPPALLPILEARGMNIIAPHKGMGAECNAAYEEWKESKGEKDSNYSNNSGYSKGVRFRFIGEKGAEALDKSEEASTRMDNLAVAREMEEAGKDAKFSDRKTKEQKEIAEKVIENVIVDKETAPKTRQEAIARLSAMEQPFMNEDQNVEIYVSNRDTRHMMQFRNSDQIAVVGSFPTIIKRAVKIGELPVAQDEQKTTKTVSVYYCPIKVGEKQYSGRMIVKEYYEGTQSVDELHLYNVMLKKSAPVAQNVSPEGLPIYPTSADVYKVKDLIHNTQEQDKVLLGLDGITLFSVDEASEELGGGGKR